MTKKIGATPATLRADALFSGSLASLPATPENHIDFARSPAVRAEPPIQLCGLALHDVDECHSVPHAETLGLHVLKCMYFWQIIELSQRQNHELVYGRERGWID
jgi:hypothetical protein